MAVTRPYTAQSWETGDIITKEKLTNIEDALEAIDFEITGARGSGSASGTLGKRIDDLIMIQNTQPTSMNNKIWIHSTGNGVQVPTYEEFTNLCNSIASVYSSTKTYKVDDLVFYNGKLYKCITAITTAEDWDSEKWEETSIIDDSLSIEGAAADGKATGKAVADLKSALIDYNSADILSGQLEFVDKSWSDISFTWNGNIVTVVGTPTTTRVTSVYYNKTALPDGIEAGKTYTFVYESTDLKNLFIEFLLYSTESSYTTVTVYSGKTDVTIPSDTIGLIIRYRARTNATINAQATRIISLTAMTNSELESAVNNITADSESIQKSTINDISLQWFVGRNVNGEGVVQNNTSAALTNVLKVSEGTQIRRVGSARDSSDRILYLYVNAYENMVFKSRTSLALNDVYTVPSGVDAICFGFARASTYGVEMTTADIEAYFGIDWNVATASYVALKSVNKGYEDNLLEKFCVFSSGTRNGITYDLIDNEAHAYYVHGSTSDSISYFNFYDGMLPDCIERGKRYFVFYENSAEARNCHLKFLFYDKDAVYINVESVGYPYAFTIPDETFTMVVRLYVTKNQTVDTTIKYLKLVEAQEQKMLIPYIISFVDDDASTTNYVEKYYNSCKRNGINGNYAVITNHLDRGATDPDVLIGYEDDGMGMLIHCSDQSYSLAPEWMDRDYDGCRKNLFKGVRAMEKRGFVNFRYWVMPYGYVNDDFKRLAVDAGMKCMISSANFRSNGMEDADRYHIKRYSLNPTDTGNRKGDLADVKAAIDDMQNFSSCWLIITTHFNEWGSVTWDSTVDETGYPVGYERMNEIIQYAKASGAAVLTVPEAWRFYEPIIEANEQRYNKIRP